MLDNHTITNLSSSYHCMSIIVTGGQYRELKKSLNRKDINEILKKYFLEEKDLLSCIINNLKKNPIKNGRVFKQLNIRCNNYTINKIKHYELLLGHSADTILRCLLLTVTLII